MVSNKYVIGQKKKRIETYFNSIIYRWIRINIIVFLQRIILLYESFNQSDSRPIFFFYIFTTGLHRKINFSKIKEAINYESHCHVYNVW